MSCIISDNLLHILAANELKQIVMLVVKTFISNSYIFSFDLTESVSMTHL